jgi:hypothetical protein
VLDPERLTLAQWFWIVFAIVLAVTFACRCIDLNSSEEPLVNEQVQIPAPATGNSIGTGVPATTTDRP